MGKNQSASGLTNIIQYDNRGNISFVSGSTTLMQVSSSGAITTTGVISGSSAQSASLAQNSNLLQGTGSVGFATTASFTTASGSISTRVTQIEQVYATTGSNSFRATQSITGSLTVTGQIVAQTLNVQQVTSSIVFSSGSNTFGCDLNSRQTFTGSMFVTGGLTVNTTGVEFQVTNNGVVLGNLLTDNHSVTGSVNVTGSLLVNGLGTFSYNDNAFQGLTIRNINTGNNALAGLSIQNSSCTIVAQMNYVSTVYANTTLRDTFLFNTVGAQKLAFGTNSGGGGTRADIYFSVNPAFTLDSNNPNQIHIVGCTKNVIINYSGTDCGQKFQVNGTALITGVTSFSSAVCTPNLISTDATNTTLRINCAIVPLANYRTSDCGYGGIDFFDNGKGYQCAAKFYTFKSISSAEYYGLTNDYNGSAQLSLVSCGGGSGNNISFFTGTSNTARLRIDNNVSCFSQTVCAPILVGNATAQQIMAIGPEADIWMCSTGGGGGIWRLLGATGNTTKLFRIYDGNAAQDRLNINSSGVVCIPQGVKFGGGATTLNNYEQGSWTPALQNATVSYSDRSGTYVRIGDYVFARWGFRISSISGQSGTVTISGLPYTGVNWGSYQEPNISVSTGNLATADNAQRARVYKGNSDTSLYGRIANNGDTAWSTGDLQNGSWIIGEIFYNVP